DLDPTEELRQLVQDEYARLLALQKAAAGPTMGPTGTPVPKGMPPKKQDPSFNEMVAKKFKEWRDDTAKTYQKKIRKPIVDAAKRVFGDTIGEAVGKGLDWAVAKGTTEGIGTVLQGAGVPSDKIEDVKKYLDDKVKEFLKDKSGGSK